MTSGRENIARGSIFQEESWHPIAGSQVEAWSEQQEVEECRLIHRPRDRRWRIHFNHTVIDHNWFIELCSGPIRLDEAPETRSKGWSCICLQTHSWWNSLLGIFLQHTTGLWIFTIVQNMLAASSHHVSELTNKTKRQTAHDWTWRWCRVADVGFRITTHVLESRDAKQRWTCFTKNDILCTCTCQLK